MKNRNARMLGGLIAMALGAAFALGFAACGHEADDCHNTRTCPPPQCIEAGDALDENNGC